METLAVCKKWRRVSQNSSSHTSISWEGFLVGKSFVEYNGNGFWSPDECLEIWLEALVREIARVPSPSDWLTLAQHYWHEQAVVGFIGWLAPHVDRVVTTP